MFVNMIKYKKNIIMKRIIVLFILIPFLFGCENVFDPAIENIRDTEALYNDNDPILVQGLLGHVYVGNPLAGWSFNDVATDDAVSSDRGNGYLRIATGQWRANNSPMNGNWQNRRGAIQYINLFLDLIDNIEWASDSMANVMFKDRMRGDAHGMRALYTYHLVLEHAGWTEAGDLLGIPLLTEPENVNSDFNQQRKTMQECIQMIYDDVEIAIDNLPILYKEFNDSEVPEKYSDEGVTGAQYSRVFGRVFGNRMSATIAEAIRAQATLLAASPAYSAGTSYTYEDAANQMAIVLGRVDGTTPAEKIDPVGNIWYDHSASINSATGGSNTKEILWRANRESSVTLERDHFPPTLYGRGRLNPSQNLVDAFPMANGYPIANNPDYDPNDPYTGRDPRLALYIIFNGSAAGPSGTTIYTAEDGNDNNALGRTETSTRTGYYMKKLLRQSANPNPSAENSQSRFKAYIRYTEILLGYAEAANEAWGPTGTGTHGYSAYDVIKAIRARAGITEGDQYLEDIKADKDAMRVLIQNERRIELCFEGHRFWDLRRWNIWNDKMIEPARGMRISGGVYTVFDVEERKYEDFMRHAPIPYSEWLKFDKLVQNKGW